ncbi:MAG: Fe-S cluster assembly protein SufD [Armatimonadetes bacterium]|nr:Fe-S cluster assembly protein SufD [Armatimonadota bacterium]MDW8154871.1 Fe-S cluster assembly protein SufD [Armatimonadota bacterium]
MSEAVTRALSDAWAEPGWMRRYRARALNMFEALPLPGSTEEAWRRTPAEWLLQEELLPAVEEAGTGSLPREVTDALAVEEDRSGAVVNRNGAPLLVELDPALRGKGVIFVDLRTAAREHPELLERSLGSVIRPEENKFTAQHAAYLSGGSVLYVPRNVEISRPFVYVEWLEADRIALFPHLLVILEEGAEATLVQFLRSAPVRAGFVNLGVEIRLGDASRLRYACGQNWASEVREFGVVRAEVGRDASLASFVSAFGGSVVKDFVQVHLRGPGGSSEMLGAFFASDHQHYDYHTLQEHCAPHTTSDLLYKYAVLDAARTIFAGLIRVHPGAQRTNAFQSNRNLLLSPDARADSKPELEIMANDLRCTHGSAVSRIDEQHVFYLQSRGLTRRQAVHMMVEGFFSEVLDRLPRENLRLHLEQLVARKMGAEAPLGRVTALRTLLEEARR